MASASWAATFQPAPVRTAVSGAAKPGWLKFLLSASAMSSRCLGNTRSNSATSSSAVGAYAQHGKLPHSLFWRQGGIALDGGQEPAPVQGLGREGRVLFGQDRLHRDV